MLDSISIFKNHGCLFTEAAILILMKKHTLTKADY